MNSNQKTRKAKAGLLLIASPRFKTLGEGLRRGTYAERMATPAPPIERICSVPGVFCSPMPYIV